jgi:hypothetical protein
MPATSKYGASPAKSRLAGLIAHRDPGDPAITEARAQLAEANARAAIRKAVATWPPLSAEVKAELAIIILSGGGDAA